MSKAQQQWSQEPGTATGTGAGDVATDFGSNQAQIEQLPPSMPGDEAYTLDPATLAAVQQAALDVVMAHRDEGVGVMSQAAMDTVMQELLLLPGFRDAGTGTPTWPAISDYAMAICGNIFTGGDVLATHLGDVGDTGRMYELYGSMPALTAEQLGVDPETWRANLDTSAADGSRDSLRADFDDASDGQARHTWAFLGLGYGMQRDGILPGMPGLLGNIAHEDIEGLLSTGGSRQDFAASQAGTIMGSALFGMGLDYTGLEMGAALHGFFADDPLAQSAHFSVPNVGPAGDQTAEVDTDPLWGAAIGDQVADTTIDALLQNPVSSLAYEALPWVDNGRRDQSRLPQP